MGKIQSIQELISAFGSAPLNVIKTGIVNTAYYYNHSSCGKENTERKIAYQLRILTHVIEKGLSLPSVRKGFGKKKIEEMLNLMDLYQEKGNHFDDDAYCCALSALEAYIEKAEENECDISFIDISKYKKCEKLDEKCGITYLPAEEFWVHKEDSFDSFARARHSVRGFSDQKLPEEIVKEVIKLAQTAPSACNRQSTRVIHIQDKAMCKEILQLQGGAKGHSVSELLLVCSDLSLYGYIGEMETPYLDAGIFTMNLLYSLSFYGIASCPLIWNDYLKGKAIRRICNIPERFQIAAIVQIGYSTEQVKYANSVKRDINTVYFTEKDFD